MGSFWLSRDGERILFPMYYYDVDPRPVEKINNQETQSWQIDDPQEQPRPLLRPHRPGVNGISLNELCR